MRRMRMLSIARLILILMTVMTCFHSVNAQCDPPTPGFYNPGADCDFCPIGYYCPGDDFAYGCPSGSTTSYNLQVHISSCYCTEGGYEHASGDESNDIACFTCRKGFYCDHVAYGTACPEGSTTSDDGGAVTDQDCNVCEAGWHYQYSDLTETYFCTECSEGSWCPGGTQFAAVSFLCLNTTGYNYSPARSGSSDSCTCAPGTYDIIGSCAECEGGYYCAGGASVPVSCNEQSNGIRRYSASGSSSFSQCQYCPTDQPLYALGGSCYDCVAGYYCPGDDMSYGCPDGKTSNSNAYSRADCFCGAGTYFNDDVCESCPENYACPGGGDTLVPCLPVATSPGGTARCFCGENLYGDGFNDCNECPSDSTSSSGSQELADCTCTESGASLNLTSASCQLCPAGFWCDDDGTHSCGGLGFHGEFATSDPGATDYHQCYCIAGYSGPPTLSCSVCYTNYFCPGHDQEISCSEVNKTYSQPGCASEACCYHCASGDYWNEESSECLSCSIDYYCVGDDTAVSCPDGTGTNGDTGASAETDCQQASGSSGGSSSSGDSGGDSTGGDSTGGDSTGDSSGGDIETSTGGGDVATGSGNTNSGGGVTTSTGGSDSDTAVASTGGGVAESTGSISSGGGDIDIDGDDPSSSGGGGGTSSGLNSANTRCSSSLAVALLSALLVSIKLIHG